MNKVNKTDQEWKKNLSDEQYKTLRECGTERPFSGKYVNHKKNGTYVCAGCSNPLFASSTKYNSFSGWPSFYDVVEKGNVKLKDDSSHGMTRTEVVCESCDGHLGHLFEDGPQDKTGLRYCINSAALDFKPKG